jgi:hypothetical protein
VASSQWPARPCRAALGAAWTMSLHRGHLSRIPAVHQPEGSGYRSGGDREGICSWTRCIQSRKGLAPDTTARLGGPKRECGSESGRMTRGRFPRPDGSSSVSSFKFRVSSLRSSGGSRRRFRAGRNRNEKLEVKKARARPRQRTRKRSEKEKGSTEYRVPSTECRVPSTEYGVAEYRVAEYRVPSTELRVPSTKQNRAG